MFIGILFEYISCSAINVQDLIISCLRIPLSKYLTQGMYINTYTYIFFFKLDMNFCIWLRQGLYFILKDVFFQDFL